MKKSIIIILIVILLIIPAENMSAGGFDSSFLVSDPMENNLFSIVGIVNIPDNATLGYPSFYGSSGTATAYTVYEEPGVKGISYEIDYSGRIAGAYSFDYSKEMPGVQNQDIAPDNNTEFEEISFYNDGITETYTKDGTYYRNSAGVTVLTDYYGSSLLYSYNLGYFVCVNTGEENFHTAILDINGNMRYYFKNTYIYGSFDDNGYATMTMGGNVIYIIKLRTSPIISVQLNGRKIEFDQLPVITGGRTMVPVRAIFEALGAKVSWDAAARRMTAEDYDITVSLTVDSDVTSVNNESVSLEIPVQIINGRLMAPVRFISDCFGATVNWVAEMQRVELTTNKKGCQ